MQKPLARRIVSVVLFAALLGIVRSATAQQVVVCQTAGVAVACVAGPEQGLVVAVVTWNGNTYGTVWYCDQNGDHLAYQFGGPSTADEARTRRVPGPCLVGG